MSALGSATVAWDAQRRARALSARRSRLLARLPHRIASAAGLSSDLREWIVDDAIEFAAIEYDAAIGSQPELERVFWSAAEIRVKRAREGRYDTVRAGFQRADLAALDALGIDGTPEDHLLARAELSAALHFAALLEPQERDVFLCQHRADRRRPLGAKLVARELELPLAAVLKAERSIQGKHERFAAIYSAGRLCGYLAPAVAALAAGDEDARSADSGRELAARVHLELERCPTCTADYTRQLRYLRGARFGHQVATLFPLADSDRAQRALAPGGWRDALPDWAARLLAHGDPATSATQLAASGAARGLGTAAAVKLATFCFAGAGTLGACVASGILPLNAAPEPPPAHQSPAPRPRATPVEREPRLPHGAAKTPTATPTPRPPRRRAKPTRRTPATPGATGARSHEQTPASPAPSDAAPNGASEFDPSYQPSAPAAPAPVPAAPGASEFS